MGSLSDNCNALASLKTGNYKQPDLTPDFSADHTLLVGPGHYAVTSHSDENYIIGTDALGTCISLTLYNPNTKTAFVNHMVPGVSVEDKLQKIVSDLAPDGETLEAHVVGAWYLPDEDDLNALSKAALETLSEKLTEISNIKVKTFDVYSKKKPEGIAINTRNGDLYQGSSLKVFLEDSDEFDSYFTECCRSKGDYISPNFQGSHSDFSL